MLNALTLFLLTSFFAMLLLMFVREPMSLALFFSSGNGLIAAIAGLDMLKCAAVFIGSFGIFIVAIAVTNLVFKIKDKLHNVKNAQK